MKDCDLSGSDVSWSVMGKRMMSKVDLRNARLVGADQPECVVNGVDLTDLSDANLSKARMIEVNVEGACLAGAVLPESFVCTSGGAGGGKWH